MSTVSSVQMNQKHDSSSKKIGNLPSYMWCIHIYTPGITKVTSTMCDETGKGKKVPKLGIFEVKINRV